MHRLVFLFFSYIIFGRVSADLVVTKLVDLVTRIPDKLSLYFYDFAVICYAF